MSSSTENKDNQRIENNKEDLYKSVNERYWMIFQRDTATLSSSSRQLALGMGGVSIFGNCIHQPSYKPLLILLLFLLVLFFLLDSAQYLYTSIIYRKSGFILNKKIENNEITQLSELKLEPEKIDISNAFFYLKLYYLFMASIIFLIHSTLSLK